MLSLLTSADMCNCIKTVDSFVMSLPLSTSNYCYLFLIANANNTCDLEHSLLHENKKMLERTYKACLQKYNRIVQHELMAEDDIEQTVVRGHLSTV